MNKLTPFHLAIPVSNLKKKRILQRRTWCKEGRNEHWVDFDFFGHQLVIHFKEINEDDKHINSVDGKDVPIPHFGVVLEWKTFQKFSKQIRKKI